MKEDVTDIILNLKDLVLRVEGDEPVQLRLDVRGPATATAGDIPLPTGVEILNPELVIATINGKGRLAVDITVERGRGYVSAERNKKSSVIGVIPVDSIFSPVRRVAFTVEPTRVEQSTNFDKLTVDIETDGSITPEDALASAGDTLRTLFGLVADMSEAPQGLSLGEVSVVGSARPTSTSRSRTWTSRSAPGTASSAPRSTRSASWCSRPRKTSSPSRTSARSRWTRSCRSWTSGA